MEFVTVIQELGLQVGAIVALGWFIVNNNNKLTQQNEHREERLFNEAKEREEKIRQDAKEREERFSKQNESFQQSLQGFNQTLVSIDRRLERVEDAFDIKEG